MYSSPLQNPVFHANAMRILQFTHTHCNNEKCPHTTNDRYPLLPNSSFHFSNARNPSLLTLGRILRREVTKSSKSMGRISSRLVVRRASPRDRRGPIAASFVSAVISDPENPTMLAQSHHLTREHKDESSSKRGFQGGRPSVNATSCSNCSSVTV
jgi:hypothetical protein